jgi:hypothetical protein
VRPAGREVRVWREAMVDSYADYWTAYEGIMVEGALNGSGLR